MMINHFLLLLAAGFISAGLGLKEQHRIIGGWDIDIEEAPWQVSLQFRGDHLCGGSIYSARIIITAAHCLYLEVPPQSKRFRRLRTTEFYVLVGSELKRSLKNMVAVSAIKPHKGFTYESGKLEYDIGVLKLSSSLRMSNQVRLIPLAIEDPAPGSEAFSTGWGLINSLPVNQQPSLASVTGPENLQGINIYITVCKKWLTPNTICAGVAGQSACFGDSGGPLVFNNTLVGVVSASEHQGCGGYGIYTSVARYHKWLINTINSISIN